MVKPTRETQYVWPRCQIEPNDALKKNDEQFAGRMMEPGNGKL